MRSLPNHLCPSFSLVSLHFNVIRNSRGLQTWSPAIRGLHITGVSILLMRTWAAIILDINKRFGLVAISQREMERKHQAGRRIPERGHFHELGHFYDISATEREQWTGGVMKSPVAACYVISYRLSFPRMCVEGKPNQLRHRYVAWGAQWSMEVYIVIREFAFLFV